MYEEMGEMDKSNIVLKNEMVHLRLGLEPTWPGLEPGQNPDWDLSPRGRDSNLPKLRLGLEPTWLGLKPGQNPD